MTGLEILLSKRWIVKAQEKELYYQVKDQAAQYKKFFNEKLGYQLIVNPYVIKLEKMPAAAESWMGIPDFTEKVQYGFLCLVIAFLEDKEIEEQFTLSQLTEFIKANNKEENIDWTLYAYRRHLIKVLKFCIQSGFVIIDDGSEDSFRDSYEGDVLYENTGVSRYFVHNFATNIMDFQSTEEFLNAEWLDTSEDRGIVRRQRVYRKLLMSPGVYKNGDADEDFAYIKNYRNLIQDDFQKYFDCELQVHKTSAYLVLGENTSIGKEFPETNTLSDIILLVNAIISEEIEKKELLVPANEKVMISAAKFERIIETCKERYGSGFNKTYREMGNSEFVRQVSEQMEYLEFIERKKEYGEIEIRPIVGKLIGRYPKDFKIGGQESEQQMAD